MHMCALAQGAAHQALQEPRLQVASSMKAVTTSIMVQLFGVQVTEDTLCLSYYETACAGICNSTQRLEPIYWMCIADPLKSGANGWYQLNDQPEELSNSNTL